MIVGLLTGSTAINTHPIYVSVTEIEHNVMDKTLEISCKIFTDDFENTLRMNYKGIVDLVQPKARAAMDKLVSEYVKKHLLLQIDGNPVVLDYMGYENQEEGIVSFYQVNQIAAVKKLDITNNILNEYKKEQMNIVHVTVNGKRKSFKLSNPEEKVSFEF